MYGFCDGTPSPPSTSSITTTLNRSAVPLPNFSCSVLLVFRRNSVT